MKSYKSQNGILLRTESDSDVKHYALLVDAGRQPPRRSRTAITVTIVLIGLFAGWIGGKSLTGALQRSRPATSIDENAASQLQPDTRPPANVVAPGGRSARPKDVQSEPREDVDLQPSQDARADEKREQEKKEQADRAIDIPGEQAVKEIGQDAMDNILKANKAKRGKHLKANKNED